MPSFCIAIAIVAFLWCSAHAAPLDERSVDISRSERPAKRGSATTTATVSGASGTTFGEYLFPIQINGKPNNVEFDTGSYDLGTGGNGPGFNVTYGDGSWAAGNLTTGNLTIGGITLINQTYGLASSLSYNNKSDGILGLRPWSFQYSSYSSISNNLMPLLQQPWIGVDLEPSSLNSSGQLVPGMGEYALGWADNAHIASNSSITFHPISSNSVWYMNVTSFGVPTGDTAAPCDLDTGTTDINVPMSVAQGYWSQVSSAVSQGNGKWTFPCNATLPDFVPVIAGVKAVVPGKYATFPNDGKGSSKCSSRLIGTTGNCVLGQSFFHAQYVLYNFANKTIGFAPKQ